MKTTKRTATGGAEDGLCNDCQRSFNKGQTIVVDGQMHLHEHCVDRWRRLQKLTPEAITEAIRRGDLTIADCAEAAANAQIQEDMERRTKILDLANASKLVDNDGGVEVDDDAAIISESPDENGAYVSAWVWVSFDGTALDKEADTAMGIFLRAQASGKPLTCYMVVRECRSGHEWVRPIRKQEKVNLQALIKKWAKEEFNGEMRLDGNIRPRLDGDYYARIITDGRPPDSLVVWDGGGFYLKVAE